MTDSITPGVVQARARGVGDPSQFTYGLIYDVVKALEAHGYGPFDGRQLANLGQHLLLFLHGGHDHCYGQSAITAEPAPEAPAADEFTPAERYRAEVTQRLTTLRQSGAAVERTMVRYDQRWGHEL